MKPILFNTEMVLAILDGRKTVTRRVIKDAAMGMVYEDGSPARKPLYSPGDVLYVRETFFEHKWRYYYKADEKHKELDAMIGGSFFKWRPSIHMPKEAARIFLHVKDVRVERLQDITEEQARMEGAMPFCISVDGEDTPNNERTWHEIGPAMPHFIRIWDSTIKPDDLDKYGWDANPWVWVIEYERCEKPEV